MSLTCSAGMCSGDCVLALVLLHLLAELRDDQRQVVADEPRAAHDQQPADDRGRDDEHEHRGARAEGVGEQRREQRAAGRADEEDVDRAERRAHAPQPVGHDRLQDRADHRERGRQQDRLRDAARARTAPGSA